MESIAVSASSMEQIASALEHLTIEEHNTSDAVGTPPVTKSNSPKKPQQPKKKRDFPIYWCIKIAPEHLRDVLAKIPDDVIAHLKKQEAFHITMLFNRAPPSAEIVQQFGELMNHEVDLEISGYVVDPKGCALVVTKNFDHHELCTNAYPHISVGNTIDVKPVYNNTLLEKAFRTTRSEDEIIDHTHVKFEIPMHVTGIFTSV
jgi:hypothetical protein